MFSDTEVRRAVDLQKRSYRLLRWLEMAIEKGFVSFDAAHSFTSFPEAASSWLEEHYSNVPEDARPAKADLADFARLFGTYLESSFDLVRDPGQRLYSPEAHCFCPLCSWLIDIPHLQPKKVAKSDKKRAASLQRDCLRSLASSMSLQVSDAAIETVLGHPELREALALAAYGQDLLRRLRGETYGAATLVLWRGFAWHREGAPKKSFDLSAEDILGARDLLRRRLIAEADRVGQ